MTSSIESLTIKAFVENDTAWGASAIEAGADAIVNENFDILYSYLNSEVMYNDASVEFTGIPNLITTPSADNQGGSMGLVRTMPRLQNIGGVMLGTPTSSTRFEWQTGDDTVAWTAGLSGAMSFGTAWTGGLVCVVASFAGSAGAAERQGIVKPHIAAYSLSQFNIRSGAGSTGAVGVNWIAVGWM